MHELSIALSLIDLATEESERLHGRVTALHLKVGAMSGVVPEALESSYGLATENTPLAGSRLVFEAVPVIAFCARCDAERPLNTEQWFVCGECGSPTPDIRQGREMELVALEIEQ